MTRVYHGFGGKLYHDVPSWVDGESLFHIRLRCAPEQRVPLTEPGLGKALLDSVAEYERRQHWWANLVLLMPDHLHGLLAFPPDGGMSETVRAWKRFHKRVNGVLWQEGYFDHRLRDLDGQWVLKGEYIRENPVAKGLCLRAEEWPWRYESKVSREG